MKSSTVSFGVAFMWIAILIANLIEQEPVPWQVVVVLILAAVVHNLMDGFDSKQDGD